MLENEIVLEVCTSQPKSESGIPWLGKLPGHWKVVRAKNLFSKQKHIVAERHQDFRRLALTMQGVVERSKQDADGLQPTDFSSYQVVHPQQLIFKLIDLENFNTSRVGFTHGFTGIVSPAYIVLRKKGDNVLPEFYYYYFLSLYYQRVFNQLGNGVRSSLTADDLLSVPVVLVPLYEQHVLVSFLDEETKKIDQLVAKKQRLIELLQERRQILITHAVSKGFDLSVPMKDSGIPWLGEVPVHWDIVRLKFIAEVRSGVTKGRNLGDKETVQLPYLRVANVQDGYLDLSDITTISVMPHEIERYSLKKGDVLMNEGGDFDKLGRGTRWNGEIDPCLHQNHVFAVRPKDVTYSDWINLYTSSEPAKRYFISKSKQTTNLASISSTNIKELSIPLPRNEEREKILKTISVQTEKLDRLVSLIKRQVDIIQEYRQALISAAVTGQIDVRHYANSSTGVIAR